MTLTTYRALERDAMQRYERLRAICPEGMEIVYVMSQSVRNMMLSVAGAADITAQFHNGEGLFGVYQGTRIIMAEDIFPRNAFGQDFFAPAVVTDRYVLGMMEIGDLIIGPNDRAFYAIDVGVVTPIDIGAINYAAIEEESLVLGETSALDEFLSSFARTGLLQAAT